jgi:glycosyltransferase involved in cell wall biosynthesis
MRVALIHYWLLTWRGGEKVLKALCELFPQADVFVHVYDRELAARELPGVPLKTTFISRLPLSQRLYQKYLPLMPLALEQLDLREYDLVISNESGPAKGVIVAPSATHVCYCLSPMRYVWDMYHEYRDHGGWLTRTAMTPLLHYMRQWDQLSAQRVDRYIAISRFVATRIGKYYRREADVIYPPVAVDDVQFSTHSEDFYLSVGQLVRYKRPDLLVEAFNQSGRPLVIIGEGEMLADLRRTAKANVRLLGRQSWDVIRDHYARCRALVFPGVEDFGIVPVEAMAAGKPVIALRAGGALDTVVEGETGVFFDRQTPESLNEAIKSYELAAAKFDPAAIRAHAQKFSEARFKAEFRAYVDNLFPAQPAGAHATPKIATRSY